MREGDVTKDLFKSRKIRRLLRSYWLDLYKAGCVIQQVEMVFLRSWIHIIKLFFFRIGQLEKGSLIFFSLFLASARTARGQQVLSSNCDVRRVLKGKKKGGQQCCGNQWGWEKCRWQKKAKQLPNGGEKRVLPLFDGQTTNISGLFRICWFKYKLEKLLRPLCM